jgi:hypothetical protein
MRPYPFGQAVPDRPHIEIHRFEAAKRPLDVIVTTHKTIALVFPTQVYKLKRDMTRTRAVAASSRTFMQTDVMEVNDETPAHPPATDGGRPASVGAPS